MNRFLIAGTVLLVMTMIIGCGDDSSETSSAGDQVEKPRAFFERPQSKYVPEGGRSRFEGKGFTEKQIDDLMEIERVMTEALIRWSYRDKAALYDNEFEYIQEKYSLSEYLGLSRINAANSADSVVGYYVTGGQFFGGDSVIVDDVIVFVGINGKQIDFVNKDKLFWHRGRWIRPTVSNSRGQREFEHLIWQADSAAAAEEAEGF